MPAVHDRDTGNKEVPRQVTGLGYYQRRHIRQMEKLRRSEIVHVEEEVEWQPINARCMGSACHLYGSPACQGKKKCNALF